MISYELVNSVFYRKYNEDFEEKVQRGINFLSLCFCEFYDFIIGQIKYEYFLMVFNENE